MKVVCGLKPREEEMVGGGKSCDGCCGGKDEVSSVSGQRKSPQRSWT